MSVDFKRLENIVIDEVKRDLHSSIIILKYDDGHYEVIIDSLGTQPGYHDLKNAVKLLTQLSGRIIGIDFSSIKEAFRVLTEKKNAEDPTVGAKRRRFINDIRRRV